MTEDVRRNRAGRAIWFEAAQGADMGGVYRPVTAQGWRVILFAVLWILLCGLGGMAAFAMTLDGRAFVGMFVAGAAGLVLTARAVIRHS